MTFEQSHSYAQEGSEKPTGSYMGKVSSTIVFDRKLLRVGSVETIYSLSFLLPDATDATQDSTFCHTHVPVSRQSNESPITLSMRLLSFHD